MVEVGPSSAENDLSGAQPQPRHDFSVVQGFQVVGGEDHGPASAGDQTWRDALRLELEARAARLHQAVDAAIVLSNDGIIRWLGDPVARLSLGPNVLNPSAVILADESLPVEPRETIKLGSNFGLRQRRDAFLGRSSRSKPCKKGRRSFATWLASSCSRWGFWSANRSRRRSRRSLKTTEPS